MQARNAHAEARGSGRLDHILRLVKGGRTNCVMNPKLTRATVLVIAFPHRCWLAFPSSFGTSDIHQARVWHLQFGPLDGKWLPVESGGRDLSDPGELHSRATAVPFGFGSCPSGLWLNPNSLPGH